MLLGRWNPLILAVAGAALYLCATAIGRSQSAHDELANSLPSTNLSPDGPAQHRMPPPAPGFANASVANNPLARDARAVGEKTCIACHRLEADHFTHTFHALGLHVANRSDPNIPVCEACHGPGSLHAQKPLVKGLIIGYTKDSGTPIRVQTETCLTC